MALDPETVRLAVAKQPTVMQSVAVLVHGFAVAAQEAPADLAKFAAALEADAKPWVDAVFANTPMANQTVSLDPVALPSDVRDAFAAAAQHSKTADPHKK